MHLRQQQDWRRRCLRALWTGLSMPLLLLLAEPSPAADTVFLKDGRVLQVEKVEEVGDTVRITPFAGHPVDVPQREVLSIHPDQPPPNRLGPPPPAKVYEGVVQDMLNQMRREGEQGRR